jgi:hypothetical protein
MGSSSHRQGTEHLRAVHDAPRTLIEAVAEVECRTIIPDHNVARVPVIDGPDFEPLLAAPAA